jgi:integrase/recombinase XerD
MKLSVAIEGFRLHIASGDYSAGTVSLYRDCLTNLSEFLNDPELKKVTLQDLQAFMIYMRSDYQPKRFGGSTRPVSASHIDNHWKAIRTFFKYAESELGVKKQPSVRLARPSFEDPEVIPFTPEEIKKILAACEQSNDVVKLNGQAYKMHVPTSIRNKAIVLTLLDSGLRIGELTRLKVKEADLETGALSIAPFGTAKKTKARTVYLGTAARRAVWLMQAKRGEHEDIREDDLLFHITPDAVRHFLSDIEVRSGVKNVHPHRFRHTFAIMFLRNHGDVFTLQRILGHSELTMTLRYLDIVKSDIEIAHRTASPADNMRL